MGYKKPTTVYRLQFDDRDGLEVRAASIPIGKVMALQEQAARLKDGDAEGFDDAAEVFETFARSLRSWNLEEDDGTPIPATHAALLDLEFSFAVELLLAWFEAIASVPGPLERKLTGGSPSEVPPVPMELLSASLPS